MKQITAIILAASLLCGMAFFALKAYRNAKSYEELSHIIVTKHNVSELSTNQLKRLGDILSLGFYDGYDEVLKEQKKLIERQALFKQSAVHYTLWAMAAAVSLLLLYFVMNVQAFNVTINLTALIALAGGLFMPIMMMSIHKDVQYLGEVVLTMESKGVFGSIAKLFQSHDYVVGGALLLFSIILPLLKTLSMLFLALFIKNQSARTVVRFFKMLGKWSMADVFIVATFLVFLSGSNGESSRTEVQVGLYFFLAYVMLSMLASLSADKMLQASNAG